MKTLEKNPNLANPPKIKFDFTKNGSNNFDIVKLGLWRITSIWYTIDVPPI